MLRPETQGLGFVITVIPLESAAAKFTPALICTLLPKLNVYFVAEEPDNDNVAVPGVFTLTGILLLDRVTFIPPGRLPSVTDDGFIGVLLPLLPFPQELKNNMAKIITLTA